MREVHTAQKCTNFCLDFYERRRFGGTNFVNSKRISIDVAEILLDIMQMVL